MRKMFLSLPCTYSTTKISNIQLTTKFLDESIRANHISQWYLKKLSCRRRECLVSKIRSSNLRIVQRYNFTKRLFLKKSSPHWIFNNELYINVVQELTQIIILLMFQHRWSLSFLTIQNVLINWGDNPEGIKDKRKILNWFYNDYPNPRIFY